MDRRRFLKTAGGAALVGGAGAAGWAARSAEEHGTTTDAARQERDDRSGLGSGKVGALGTRQIIYSVPTNQRVAALTFDDGPDPQFTPRVLEILAEHGIKATFMAMGFNAEHHADLMREVIAAGHEVGNHTWTHKDLSTVGAADAAYQIRRGREAIEQITGTDVRFFRPPRGELSGAALRYVVEEHNDLLMWSITGSVPGRETPQEVVQFIGSHLEPGAIVDLHDGIGRGTFDRWSPGARSLIARRTAEIAGLPRLIESMLSQGYSLMRVSDLLAQEVPGASSSMTPDDSPDADTDEPPAQPNTPSASSSAAPSTTTTVMKS